MMSANRSCVMTVTLPQSEAPGHRRSGRAGVCCVRRSIAC